MTSELTAASPDAVMAPESKTESSISGDREVIASPEEHPSGRDVLGKVFACNFAIFLAGIVDASLGPLIPYIQPSYDIDLLRVAIVYVPHVPLPATLLTPPSYLVNFTGWTFAAFTWASW